MSDRVDWDVDRVVQELCTTEGALHPYAHANTCLLNGFAAQLRHHGIRGCHLVECARDGTKLDLLFDTIGIDQYVHRVCILDACRKIMTESEKARMEKVEDHGDRTQGQIPNQRKRAQPQLVGDGGRQLSPSSAHAEPTHPYKKARRGSVSPDRNIVSLFDLAHVSVDDDDTTREFSLVSSPSVGPVIQRAANQLYKRGRLRDTNVGPWVPRGWLPPVDRMTALSDPFDPIFPALGDSSDELDDESDTAASLT
jgi:hypothetical protein